MRVVTPCRCVFPGVSKELGTSSSRIETSSGMDRPALDDGGTTFRRNVGKRSTTRLHIPQEMNPHCPCACPLKARVEADTHSEYGFVSRIAVPIARVATTRPKTPSSLSSVAAQSVTEETGIPGGKDHAAHRSGRPSLCSISLWSRVVAYLKQTREYSDMVSSLQSDRPNEGRNNLSKIPGPTYRSYWHYVKLQIVPHREQIRIDCKGQQVTGRVIAAY